VVDTPLCAPTTISVEIPKTSHNDWDRICTPFDDTQARSTPPAPHRTSGGKLSTLRSLTSPNSRESTPRRLHHRCRACRQSGPPPMLQQCLAFRLPGSGTNRRNQGAPRKRRILQATIVIPIPGGTTWRSCQRGSPMETEHASTQLQVRGMAGCNMQYVRHCSRVSMARRRV
jgi:hypothetical protein